MCFASILYSLILIAAFCHISVATVLDASNLAQTCLAGRLQGIQNLNVFLAHPLSPFKFGGVFHAGVEIGGEEWSFGNSAGLDH